MAFEFDRIVPFDPRGDLEKSEIIDRFACSKLKYILAKINTCRNFLNVKTWTDDEDIYIYIYKRTVLLCRFYAKRCFQLMSNRFNVRAG